MTTARPFWERYGDLARRQGVPFLVTTVLLSVLAAIEAPTIETSADPTAYLPRDRPEVASWLDLNARFGALDLLLVGLEEPGQGLSDAGLEALQEITRRLEDLKAQGVLSVRSLMNVDTVTPDETGTLHADRLVPSLPQSPAERSALAQRILSDALVPGSLVSRDLRAYAILVRPDPRKDLRTVARLVEEAVLASRGPLTTHFFGGPFIANLVTRKVYDRLPWLMPLFAGVLLVVLGLGTRKPWASPRTRAALLVVVLAGAGLSLVWWLGLLSILGLSLTMSDVNGLLLVLIAAALFYGRLADSRMRGDRHPPPGLVAFALACAAALVLFDALGPLLPVPLPYLGRLGSLLAAGLLAVVCLGLLGVWPVLARIHESSGPARPPDRSPRSGVRVGLIALLAVASLAAFQVRFVSGLRDLFSDSDEVGTTLAFFDRHFGGSDFLQVSAQGDLREPGNLARIHRLTDLLEGSGIFADVRSITQVIGFLAQNFSGAYRVPDDRDSLNTLWFFLDGNEDVRALVTPAHDEAMLALRVPPDRDPLVAQTVVEQAILDSLDTGPTGAIRRLEAVARAYGVDLPPGRSAAVVAQVTSAARGPLHDEALAALRQELESPEFPFVPTPDEWTGLAGVLRDFGGGRMDIVAIERAIASLPSFQALGAPADWARRVAEMIGERLVALDVQARSEDAVERWLSGLPPDRRPAPLMRRAIGVLQDLLRQAPQASPGDLSFLVTGYPVVLPVIERDLRSGLFRAIAGVVLAFFLAGWVCSGRARPPLGLLAGLALAGMAPLGVLWLTGLHVDSGSAAMVLAGPLAVGFLRGASDRPDARTSRALALALAGAAASLAVTGVLPVVRIGVVLGLALLSAWLLALSSLAAVRTGAGASGQATR